MSRLEELNAPSNFIKILSVIGILLIAANLRAPFTALPPLLEPIVHDFNLSAIAAGGLTTLPLLAFALLSPFSAIFSRQFGLERTLFIALIIIAAGIVLRSSGAAPSLYFGTCLIGIGIAFGNVLLPSLIKRDFSQHITSLTGAYVLAMGIAAAIGSAIVIPLADLWGWRISLLSFLILAIAALVIWIPQLKSPHPLPPQMVNDRQSRNIWSSTLAWQITFFLGLNSTIYYVIVSWLPAILTDSGMSPAQAGSIHGVLQLATAVPGLILGVILRRLADQRIIAVTVCIFPIVALMGFAFAPNLALIWSVLFGIGTGAGIILGLSFIGLRTQNAHQAVMLSGMSQCIGYLLAATGPMAMGAVHKLSHSWLAVLLLCSGFAAIAAIMGYFAGKNRFISR